MVQSSQQYQSQPCSCNYVLKCVLHVKEGTFSSPHFFFSLFSLLLATLSQSLDATLKVTAWGEISSRRVEMKQRQG